MTSSRVEPVARSIWTSRPRSRRVRKVSAVPVRPARPVRPIRSDVGVVLARDVEVDHEADALDVEATGGDVGRHQDVEGAVAQTLDELLALLLRHVAGERGGLDALAGQLERDLLGGAFVRTKTMAASASVVASTRLERADLVLERHDGVGLVHRGDGGRGPGDGDAERGC